MLNHFLIYSISQNANFLLLASGNTYHINNEFINWYWLERSVLKGHPEGRETFLASDTQSRTLWARSGSHFTTLRIRVLFWNGQTNKCALNVHIGSGEFTELQLQGVWCHLTLHYVHRYLSPGFHVVRLNGGIYAVHVPKNYPIFTCSAPSHMRLILSLKKGHQKGTRAVKKLNSFRNTLIDQETNDASLNGSTSPTSPNKRP